MARFLLICSITFFPLASFAQYDSKNISLLGNWFSPNQYRYAGCWGYVANGREYAIIGSGDGTHIIEVTDPYAPVERAYIAGRKNNCTWREYKTYQNYLYAVSDDKPINSLQIIDLSFLPDSVQIVHDDTTIFKTSHTIYIDGDKLYCASAGGGVVGFAGIAVFSLANPIQPQLLRKLSDDNYYCSAHDMFVRNDTIYASCMDNGLFIFKFQSDQTFRLIGSISQYAGQGYSHSSYLTPDGKSLVLCDEVPLGLSVKIADLSDFTDLKIISTFQSHAGATPHNPYMVGYHAVIAYYEDGIQVYNICDPAHPVRTGYFDTYPQNDTVYYGFAGCWGAYTDLPSGILLASDGLNGLFILDPSLAYQDSCARDSFITTPTYPIVRYHLYPNPFSQDFHVDFELLAPTAITFELWDMLGRKIFSLKKSFPAGNNYQTIVPPPTLSHSFYLLKAIDENGYLIKENSKVLRME